MTLVAKNSFKFHTSSAFVEITGKKAGHIRDLIDLVRNADDSSIFCHTHLAIKELHFTKKVYTNDFAIWVRDALGEDELAESLGSIDLRDYSSLGELKEAIVKVLDDYLREAIDIRMARKGNEFYLCRLTEIITPTEHVVWTLFDLREAIERVSMSSIFYHFFEAKLRCGRNTNDFSMWIDSSLDEKELAKKIEQLDPYLLTLEELRHKIIEYLKSEENVLKLLEATADQTRTFIQKTSAVARIIITTPFKEKIKTIKDAFIKGRSKGKQ